MDANAITDNGLINLPTSNRRQLILLSLNNNGLTWKGMKYIVNAGLSLLQALFLGSNDLNSSGAILLSQG